ncbi:ABC1 family-domain-containing protein, partial [Baffinella frigidus]
MAQVRNSPGASDATGGSRRRSRTEDAPPPPPDAEAVRQERSATMTRERSAIKSAEPGARYDVMAAEKYFEGRIFEVWRRDLQISVPLTLFLARVILDVLGSKEELMRPQRAKEFMELIASLGPAFIKAGQALSSRPDLLPPEYLTELVKLQDRVEPFGNEEAFRIIEEQLGMPISEVFDKVEPTPVAAASIGQVYKGYLKTGEAVAIKVQRPELEEKIALDIYILRQLSGLLSQLIAMLRRDIDLQSVVEEFGKLIYEEIDYLQEARNCQDFAELYGGKPDIYVPMVHWKLCRRKILVMEWVDGVRLTSPSLAPATKTKLVNSLVQCSLQQMLDKGFFHADPHGGNLLATPDGRLVYLDFGMMSKVDTYQRYGILEAVIHLVNRDFEALSKLYVRLGFIPPDTDLRPIQRALEDALPDVLGASVETFNIANVIGELGDI